MTSSPSQSPPPFLASILLSSSSSSSFRSSPPFLSIIYDIVALSISTSFSCFYVLSSSSSSSVRSSPPFLSTIYDISIFDCQSPPPFHTSIGKFTPFISVVIFLSISTSISFYYSSTSLSPPPFLPSVIFFVVVLSIFTPFSSFYNEFIVVVVAQSISTFDSSRLRQSTGSYSIPPLCILSLQLFLFLIVTFGCFFVRHLRNLRHIFRHKRVERHSDTSTSLRV